MLLNYFGLFSPLQGKSDNSNSVYNNLIGRDVAKDRVLLYTFRIPLFLLTVKFNQNTN